jgi:hypothetical protein
MITVNVIETYLENRYMNTGVTNNALLPQTNDMVEVKCGSRLFCGRVDRESVDVGVRLQINLEYGEDNAEYNGFMQSLGVGAVLHFRAINADGNVIIGNGEENNGTIVRLELETINYIL